MINKRFLNVMKRSESKMNEKIREHDD